MDLLAATIFFTTIFNGSITLVLYFYFGPFRKGRMPLPSSRGILRTLVLWIFCVLAVVSWAAATSNEGAKFYAEDILPVFIESAVFGVFSALILDCSRKNLDSTEVRAQYYRSSLFKKGLQLLTPPNHKE